MQKRTKYKLYTGIGALAALVYILIPVDISPDPVPVIGWIDDIVALLLSVANGVHWASKLRKSKKEGC